MVFYNKCLKSYAYVSYAAEWRVNSSARKTRGNDDYCSSLVFAIKQFDYF